MTSAALFPRRKLPIGLQSLRELRESGCYYVDKSGMAVDFRSWHSGAVASASVSTSPRGEVPSIR
jgi:hypothetical protein